MPAFAALASTPPIRHPVHTAYTSAPWELGHKNGTSNPFSPFLSTSSPDTKFTQSKKLQPAELWSVLCDGGRSCGQAVCNRNSLRKRRD